MMTVDTAASGTTKPWIYSSFLNDAKLRVRERYWRELQPTQKDDASSSNIAVLPDALSWRTHLRLIQALVTDTLPLQWYLCESVVEYMDHRNQSPVIDDKSGGDKGRRNQNREPAAPQERSLLQRLVQQGKVVAFCDVSVRLEDENWDDWMMDMTIEEKSRHALVRAAQMTQQQETENPRSVVVLCSESPETRLALAEEDGMKYMDMGELLGWLAENNHISNEQLDVYMDMKKACQDEYNSRINPTLHSTDLGTDSYTSEEAIQKGLRDGKLFRGRLTVTKENTQEAFVSMGNEKLYVDGQKGHFGHAIHQDVVIVQALDQTEWGRPVGRRRLVYHNTSTDDDTQTVRHHEDVNIPAIPSARVIAVDKPGRRQVVATVVDTPSQDESAVLVVPMDVRIPKIRVRTRAWNKFQNKRLKIQIDDWETGSKYPHGHCIDILGPIGDLETEIVALLLENQVQLDPFSLEAMACLPPEGDKWAVSEHEAIRRKDLRSSRRVFSVDPPGCQDIDDTMHAEVLPNGDIEVGVHIADVTKFVKHNSRLDKEAQVRGTTFYLVDRRFDMLPSLLSSNLCSLHGGMDRLAVSVIWTLSSDLEEVKSCWYGRTVIHNCAAMTYDQADRILRDLPPDDPSKPSPPPLTAGSPVDPMLIRQLKHDLLILTKLGRKLKSDREEIGGAVDLSSGDRGTELKFTLDENGNPTRVTAKEDKEIHHTIAEMMIMANTYVASKIFACDPSTALLRVHSAVQEESFEDLKDVLASYGVSLDGSSNMALADSLKVAQERENSNAIVNSLFKSLATRAMTEARYICTGDGTEDADFSHYGLGLGKYTHFTSPIRRYADVVIHKQLLAALEDEELPVQPKAASPPEQDPLSSLPESNVVSILAGEGLDAFEGDDIIDSLTAGAADLVLDSETAPSVAKPVTDLTTNARTPEPYATSEVASICEGLNLHNRLAKQSSMECQNLFLSLYFKSHVEITHAVVINVRTNGFWVYVPKFDMKGPVYVRDMEGSVQIDPALVGLPADAGLDPTVGFSLSDRIRRFPNGTCTLVDSPEERLDVSVPGGKKVFSVRALDVVTISLSCENWDVRARVPSPRLLLLSTDDAPRPADHTEISSSTLSTQTKPKSFPVVSEETSPSSIADTLFAIRLSPVLPGVPYRSASLTVKELGYQETIGGRRIFEDFVNPDTRSAAQEAAQQAAAAETAQRRQQLLEASSRRHEYDTSRAIERNVTMRQQRLAADKRNTRKSKAK